MYKITHSAGRQTGKGMAIAGAVCGYVGIAFWGLMFLIAVSASSSGY